MAKKIALLFALLALTAIAAVYTLYSRFPGKVWLTPSAIQRLGQEIFPHLTPPEGTTWVLGIQLDRVDVVVLAASLTQAGPDRLEGRQLRFVVGRVRGGGGEEESLQQVQDLLESQRDRKAKKLKVIEKGLSTLRVHGLPRPCRKTLSDRLDGGGKVLEYTIFYPRPGQLSIVQISGPEASFNLDLAQEFLGSLEPERLRPERRRRR